MVNIFWFVQLYPKISRKIVCVRWLRQERDGLQKDKDKVSSCSVGERDNQL